MELIFDQRKESFEARELYDAIHYAHQKKIKAIYYIRTIKNNASVDASGKSEEENCVACAG
jgi:hypothetical protein